MSDDVTMMNLLRRVTIVSRKLLEVRDLRTFDDWLDPAEAEAACVEELRQIENELNHLRESRGT